MPFLLPCATLLLPHLFRFVRLYGLGHNCIQRILLPNFQSKIGFWLFV